MSCNGDCTCGCCSGIRAETPATIYNRAGLSSIAYRTGVHSSFKRSMLAALSRLAPIHLTTRDDDDFSIALLDSFAVTADVLTFYQERIANESYLRTARERLSILELARLIGYELAPAIAAQTWLAFNLQTGAPEVVNIDPGTRVQSVPGQNETPQTFETTAPLAARLEWNEVPARTTVPRLPMSGDTSLWLAGTETGLRRGDALLFLSASNEGDLRRLVTVDARFNENRTLVTWSGGLSRNATRVMAMRIVTGLFGHNAPHRSLILGGDDDWTFTLSPVLIAGAHPTIRPDSWVVLQRPGLTVVYQVDTAAEVSHSDYAVSGDATQVVLDPTAGFAFFQSNYRQTRAFAGSEELALAEAPNPAVVSGQQLLLDRMIPAPEGGRAIVVVDDDGGELARVASVETAFGTTLLQLDAPLSRSYERARTRVRLNVAAASHGESLKQVLGSGDATKSFQRFELSRAPLTYVSDPLAPRGAKSTLTIQVSDVRWREVETLFNADPRQRIFATRRDAEAKTAVLFGDGKTAGPRLPSGSNNVRATYRVGAGAEGNVGAKKLTTLLTIPLGVKDVINPMPAEGGADGELMADARRNAPRTILTIDRVVSLRDYESFAAAFMGIGKALATWSWSGTARQVFVTIAGPTGQTFGPSSAMPATLANALRNAGDPFVPLRIASYRSVRFRIAAKVGVDPHRDPAVVLAAVREALQSSFSFAARAFGQAVSRSEVIAVIQNVTGVVYVDLDAFHRATTFPWLASRLTARGPEGNLGAELLTLADWPMNVVEVA